MGGLRAWRVAIAFYAWAGGAEETRRTTVHERLALAAMLPSERLVKLHTVAQLDAAARSAKRRTAWRVFFTGGGYWRMAHDGGEGAATGLNADAGGFWAVHDVVDVRRPVKRKGQQLEVLISWAAHDWAGRQWADEWHPITFLKRRKPDAGDGLYERARAMEAVKYATERVVGQEGAAGVRYSPRLAEAQEERI